MTTIIDQLEQDHANMANLLVILNGELDNIRRVQDPDYELMRMILEYMLTYPDAVHHPKEDVIYQILIRQRPDLADTLYDLEADHEETGKQTRAFADMLNQAQGGEAIGREELCKAGQDFVDAYRIHMRKENQEIFPKAREHLTFDNWELAAEGFDPSADPLFGDTVEDRFAKLYQRIQVAAG